MKARVILPVCNSEEILSRSQKMKSADIDHLEVAPVLFSVNSLSALPLPLDLRSRCTVLHVGR